MSGTIDLGSYNYVHGIVSQDCLAKEYSDAGISIKLLPSGTFVQVHAVRDEDVVFCVVRDDMDVETNKMVCKKADIINVPENLWEPLFTLEKIARLSLVKDSKIAESIGNISVGHTVQVLGPDNSVICIANVTFKNYIGTLGVGVYFGLQVLSSRENLQTIRDKVSVLWPGAKGFPCGCDIVVTVDKILPSNYGSSKDKSACFYEKEYKKPVAKSFSSGEDISNGSFKSVITYNLKEKQSGSCKKDEQANRGDAENMTNHTRPKKKTNLYNPLNVGDEVIYLNGDTPEKGIVRWIGLIEDSPKVEVEFGSGPVDGLGELFRAKYWHSLIVPPMELIKLSDYLMNVSKEEFHITKSTTNGSFKSVITYNLKEKQSGSCKKDEQANRGDAENVTNHTRTKKKINPYNPLNVGDEVIYLNGDTPEKGIVRWIGLIEDSPKVEVEFGSGPVDGVGELFRAKYWHSLIVPPMALIKLSDYLMNVSKEEFHITKSTTTNNNNNHNLNHNNNNSSNINSSTSNNNNINNNNNNNNSSSNNNKNSNGNAKTNYYPKTNISIKNNNNSNNVNNNEDCCRSYEFGFDGKQNIEDSYKKSKKVSVSHQCLKHPEKNFEANECFPSEEEVFGGKDSFKAGSEQERSHRAHVCTGRKSQNCSNGGGEDDFIVNESSSGHSGGKNWRSFYEKDAWGPQRPDHSDDVDENQAGHCDLFRASGFFPDDLGKGSVVELTFRGEPHYGVIRWIGTLPEEREAGSCWLTAGIEMEEEHPEFTDGTCNNKRYFRCNPKKALFVPLSMCRKDSRFLDESQKQTTSPRINYGQMDCPVVEGTIPPINRKGDIESICGKNRGIQGHHNSCYLDATLFSMFAFTSVFDSLLYRPPTKNDIPQYSEVQRVLREEIVNPLRKNLYVRADRVMKLRTLLEKLSSVSGLTSEEKDPEEFLNSLLAQILKAEPFLKLSSGQEAFHYQLFVEKDERLVLPSVQQLLEQSFLTSDIKLKQVPSCLIIQMPRFGKSFKMYSRILPPQLLDITDIIENSPRQCTVCGKLAAYECKDCFGQQGIGNGLESISFCKVCSDTVHNHHCRNRHDSRALTVPEEFYELQEHCVIPRLYMELFAVVCIETSHYVAFVKCGSGSDAPWCFFDSMADRKGEQNGYNIPEMVPCPDLPYWLSEDGAKTLNEMRDERQLTEHAKRLFSDAYMCMYQSPDLMMYR